MTPHTAACRRMRRPADRRGLYSRSDPAGDKFSWGHLRLQAPLRVRGEVADCEERLTRYYRSIEDRIVELDDIVRERTPTLKSKCERAKAALDRARAECGTAAAIDSAKIDAFARLMNEKLGTADTSARKT